ncbi:MAG: glycosyltransferase [Patescibacteria group bacterium]
MIKSLAVNIITHNGLDSFILEAIRSVRNYVQEIVVIDDGSIDDTRFAIKNEFGEARIIRFDKSHTKERAMLLNVAKAETKAEWILRIDDDEIMPEETMEEIMALDGVTLVYSIPFLHYEDGGFIDPKCHKKNTLCVARLFKNIPEVTWKKEEEVICYNGTPVSSRANQIHLCRMLKNPFLHFGDLKKNRHYNYVFHKRGHCKLPLTKNYLAYVPSKN